MCASPTGQLELVYSHDPSHTDQFQESFSSNASKLQVDQVINVLAVRVAGWHPVQSAVRTMQRVLRCSLVGQTSPGDV